MPRKIFLYNPKLKERARELRKNGTLSEVLLWNKLKNKQIRNLDFHRQKPIDNFIVDFYYHDLMLAIEIDGATHFDKEKYDMFRENKLECLGVKILRFGDRQVKRNLESVIMEIEELVDEILKLSFHVKPTPRWFLAFSKKTNIPLPRGDFLNIIFSFFEKMIFIFPSWEGWFAKRTGWVIRL